MPVTEYSHLAKTPAESRQGPTSHLPVKPNSAWFYAHHRSNWDFVTIDGKPVALPQLHKLWRVPGQNLVRAARKGEEADDEALYSDAVVRMKREGCVVLTDFDLVNEYVREYPAKNPKTKQTGTFYAEAHTVPRAPSEPGKRMKFRMNQDAYNRWRFSLMTREIIEAPTPEECKAYGIEVDRAIYEASQDTSKTAEQRAPKIEKLEAKKAIITEAAQTTADAVDAAIEDAPKPKRRRSRKKTGGES